MALTINVIARRGPGNEMCHQLQPKKTKVRLYQEFYLPFNISKTERISFKSGYVVSMHSS